MWPPAPCAQTRSAPLETARAGSKIAEASSFPTSTRHSPAITRPRKRALFHPILDLGEGPAGALFVELAAGGAAHSEAADGVATGHDGDRALRVGHVWQLGLRHVGRRVLRHAVGDLLGGLFLARQAKRSARVGLVISVVHRADRAHVVAPHGLRDAA